MQLLLDTNAFFWSTDPSKLHNLGKKARQYIENADVVFYSPISIAELVMKSMLKKLALHPNLETAAQQAGFVPLLYSDGHARALEAFPKLVKHDPFDRVLLAQAHADGIMFLTSDQTLIDQGLDFVVSAWD